MARPHSQFRLRVHGTLVGAAIFVGLLFAVLWIASLFQGTIISRETLIDMGDGSVFSADTVVVGSLRGRLFLNVFDADWPEVESSPRERAVAWSLESLPREQTMRSGDAPNPLAWIGIDWRKAPPDWFSVAVPHWLPMCIAGAAAWLLGRRGRIVSRRLRNGQCPACGYDIRMSPDRCPECGSPLSPLRVLRERAG